MARPYRPNPNPIRNSAGVITNHPRQETRTERKARLRAEAETRNALTSDERRLAFRREYLRKAAQESVR